MILIQNQHKIWNRLILGILKIIIIESIASIHHYTKYGLFENILNRFYFSIIFSNLRRTNLLESGLLYTNSHQWEFMSTFFVGLPPVNHNFSSKIAKIREPNKNILPQTIFCNKTDTFTLRQNFLFSVLKYS